MRAAVIRRVGPPEVLSTETVADPVPAADQVLIEVEYAATTFVETQVRAGRPPNPAMQPDFPAILGNGVVGVVTAVGTDSDEALLGGRVVSTTGGRGGYAELVAVPAAGIIPVPDNVSSEQAAALLADGRTALALLGKSEVARGETVLVEAAAGGVGTCLIQLVRARGARVIACASTPEKLDVAEDLGAEVLANYSHAGWAEDLRAAGEVVDVVFDGVGGDVGPQAATLLRDGGRFVQYGMASGSFSKLPDDREPPRFSVVRGLDMTPDEAQQLSRRAIELAGEALLRPIIGQVFDLESASEAHAAMEARQTIGKTLLRVRAEVASSSTR